MCLWQRHFLFRIDTYCSLLALFISSVFLTTPLKADIPFNFSDGFSDYFGEAIGDDLAVFMDESNFAGAVVGIIDGRKEGFVCLGYADLMKQIPVTENTLFEVGSVTKVFTGILLAHAIKEGRLSLADSIADLLKEEGNFSNLKDVTIEDLVTHRSGLPKVMDSPAAIIKTAYLFMMNKNPYDYYTTDRVLEYLSTVDVDDRHGSYKYSNLGVGLLGYILCRTYGASYEELLKRYICDPFHMDASYIHVPENKKKNFAVGYLVANQSSGNCKEAPYWNLSEIMVGAGGMRSCSTDMMQFLRRCVQGSDPGLNDTLQLLTDDNMAMCWHVISIDNKPVYFHNGGTGGFRSCILFYREDEVGVFVLLNSLLAPEDLSKTLLKKLMDAKKPDSK
jgi:beta-lactamase class C